MLIVDRRRGVGEWMEWIRGADWQGDKTCPPALIGALASDYVTVNLISQSRLRTCNIVSIKIEK